MSVTEAPALPEPTVPEVRPFDDPSPTRVPRLTYLDNLKIVLTIGVITAHILLVYGPGPGFLGYHEGNVGTLETLILGIPGVLGGLFWLGVFFLIAGMFVPKSLKNKGTRVFVQDRILRLGIPLVVFALVVMPVVKYLIARVVGRTHDALWIGPLHQVYPFDAGPLWFVGALMVFSVAYAIYDRVWPGRPKGEATITARGLILLAIAIAATTFIFRLEWPLYSNQLLGLHLWQWPQYVLLFWAGAWAAERGWPTLTDRLWRELGWAILATMAVAAILMLSSNSGLLPRDQSLYGGGWHWEAIFAPAIEGVLAVCGPMWLLGFFRRKVNFVLPLGKQLARSYYGAYVFQAVVVVALVLTLRSLGIPSELKVLIVAPLGIAGSFAVAYYLVKLPAVGKVL